LAFVEFLRRIVNREISPEEAVKAYHGVLAKLNIKPHRSLADDLTLQTGVMSYGGSNTVSVPAGAPSSGAKPVEEAHHCACGGPDPKQCHCDDGHSHEDPSSVSGNVIPRPSLNGQPSTNGKPDFAKMSRADKLAYNKAERDRVFGQIGR
jgi:hypothetical protein